MNGIQFYLEDDVPIGRGHQIYLDSPWALTSVSQAQFWTDVDLSRFGDGNIRGVISVDISDWDTPGLNGKPARECTRREIRDEVWDQLKRSLNVQGANVLEDEDLVHWYLDLDVDPLLRADAEPLFVNLVDTWRLRPRAVTAIPNLFLASDYVQTFTDLATMEAANEAARRAVNGILAALGVGRAAVPALGPARAGAAGALARERSSALPAGPALGRHRCQARAVGAGGALPRGQRARGIDRQRGQLGDARRGPAVVHQNRREPVRADPAPDIGAGSAVW